MAIGVALVYDDLHDQLVAYVPAADGDGDVELLRMDVKQLGPEDKRRLRDVRDPEQPQAAPGDVPVTRR
jgi:hypothetical protein